jgi:hypothetical protein
VQLIKKLLAPFRICLLPRQSTIQIRPSRSDKANRSDSIQDTKGGSDKAAYGYRSWLRNNIYPTTDPSMSSAVYKNGDRPAKIGGRVPPKYRALKMASTFKSFLDNARQTISGASTPAPGTPAENTPCEALFPKVDRAVDGEDCDHDCDSCHVQYPKGFKIDEEDRLYGYVKGWSTHVLVATGKTDWVRDVADEKGSVMEAIEKKANVKPSNGVCSIEGNQDLVLTIGLEIDAFGFEYTHSVTLGRLFRANNRPLTACLHLYRERHSQFSQHSHIRIRQ